MKTVLVQRVCAAVLTVPSVCCVCAYAREALEGRRPLTERFKQLDRNGDGKLSRDEVSRPALFRRLDQDGDGFVTLEEARKALSAPSRPAGAAGD